MRIVALAALWVALAAAGPVPRPAAPPPPDLTRLVPLAEAPLDKPALALSLPLPAPPVDLPPLPPAPVVPPAADKPTAFLQSPRTLPCVGAWLGIPSESLECGRARFARGEDEDAAKALERATRAGADPDVQREARYWLGETYYRLGRMEQADWLFRQVAQGARDDWSVWALHSSAWTALRLGDGARARDTFTQLLAVPLPAPLDTWGRYGLGLADYALGRWQDAEQAWAAATTRGVPPALARDVLFWHGEAVGRAGDPARAVAELRRFTQGGPHPLLAQGLLRLGWWALAAERAPDAAAAFRAYLATPAGSARVAPGAAPERDWAEAGLATALLSTGDWAGARTIANGLASRTSPLALPVLLRVARASLDATASTDPDAVIQQLLGLRLTPPARAWVLLLKGEVERVRSNADDARTQFDLARNVEPGSTLAWQAAFRLALTNFEVGEFQDAVTQLQPLLNASVPRDLRLAALLLRGEAGYRAGDYVGAAAAFRRALTEFPGDPKSALARLALAWADLRQDRPADARREFLEFAKAAPDDANAADALELAAELAARAGDFAQARQLLDRVIASYPAYQRADFARLNRAILLVRARDFGPAETALRDWLGRAPFPALFGRARAALAATLLETGRRAEAATEFGHAQHDGAGGLAILGLGAVALADAHWDDATREFTQARDAGPADVAAAARYGLAVVAFHQGKVREFKPVALAEVDTARKAHATDRVGALLDVLTAIAVDEKDWPDALGYVRRIVAEAPRAAMAPDAIERVAAGAAHAEAWPVAYEADTLLRRHYPTSPFVAASRFRFDEEQVETGHAEAARRDAEQFLAQSPTDAAAGRALLVLARAREALGDRAGALDAYARAARDTQGAEWSQDALLGHARLLVADKKWDQARGVFERLLKAGDGAVAARAARGIGDTYAGEGDLLAAADYYMTAAYLAPATPAGRQGLLGAAQALASLKQADAAAIVYRKLLAQADLPPDVADAARQGLAALKR